MTRNFSFLFCGFLIVSPVLIGCSGDCKVRNARRTEFVVPQIPAGEPYLRFLAIGDFGTGDAKQKAVAGAMAENSSSQPAAFVVLLGDNFYANGVTAVDDRQFAAKFENVYHQPSLQIPFYAVLGNHDYRGNPQAQVEYTAVSRRWKMPARFYTFVQTLEDSTAVQFFALDTTPIATGDAAAAAQLAWIKDELQKSRASWRIAFGHHPLFSGGYHGGDREADNMREKLETIFEEAVDLYLCGHDHDQQLIKAPGKRPHYVVSGAGGAGCRDVAYTDDTLFATTNAGFCRFRLSRRQLLIEFISAPNQLEYAHVINKNETE
jgi:3',5'-cyclic AMP phosphodiesterase CpdA